ncbi:MAG: LPXTG cell wall anchor domain-containing protein, partial [Oscillospiraceae bacterium]|nr:LPXTG cell wall anchor domain-containing protein [Oscillospiraceae bacterium]
DTINKALADVAEDFNAYDLSFLFNDEVIQPNGDVKVSFPIPNDYAPDDTSIYHLDKDGKVVKMDTDLNADKSFISFESDSFSVYAIVKELNNTPTTTEADATTTAAATTAAVTTVATAAATTAAPNPSTGDSTTLFASMVILAASAASMVFIRRKK